ncbi:MULTISPECIES: MurR/RpiR family transcriptional regulator [Clostridium]|uniref:MurR/RpiR family transcriptional regulator n=1 Tax=Clostridium TaxID=1485 RepID=UPI0006651A24|nr:MULTISPECIES: MurR/RpiR family transcriptional regulator [Clostridium]MDB2106437.1 MurR/RpiR family transcriptional regulator [Clostridium paraputrificum]MDB2114413.1 MurR/RpiR family transcriptional regulator [Clostridium paraputrificum]MDU1033814.1 MurR/RpiR family transcriptional regulator [Clostridium sp.]
MLTTYSKSVIPIIEAAYEDLTNVEKSIADYFINNVSDDDLSSRSVSQRLFVSEASLSRFSKKLGFSGYRQFLFEYKGSKKTDKNLDILTKQVLNSYQKVLEKTYHLIDNGQMIRLANMLDEYERVYVYGIGSSSVVAREFKLRFMRLGLDVDYLAEAHSIRMNITRVNEKSLVIGISVSGRTQEVVEGLRDAKDKGAKTVMISANKVYEYRDYYDELVLIGGLKNLAVSDKISPQVPALIVIDVLYTHYLNYNNDNKKEKLKMTLEHVEYEIEE